MKIGIVILVTSIFLGTGIVFWNQYALKQSSSSLSSPPQDIIKSPQGNFEKSPQQKNKISDVAISRLECTPDPKGGKLPNCVCQTNPNKENLTIILNEQGIYNTDKLYSQLTNFLDAAAADVNLNHIGISYYSGNDVASLDAFIEQLYDDYNVGYAIIVGDELDLMQPLKGSYDALSFDLSTVRKNQSKDQNWNCRDVALSWILPPKDISNNEKVSFVTRVFDTYTKYHKNQDDVLGQFGNKFVSVQWTNGNPSLGADLPVPIVGYENLSRISNLDFQNVENTLKNKVKLLHYYVHGYPNVIGLGLNPNNEEKKHFPSAVYTTLDEFSNFASGYGSPALFVQSESCGSMVNQGIEASNIKNCCWPQRFLGAGVWAYYGIGGGTIDNGGNQKVRAEQTITKTPFLGYLFRRIHLLQYIIFGDITAHF